jgi:hypothetical protein
MGTDGNELVRYTRLRAATLVVSGSVSLQEVEASADVDVVGAQLEYVNVGTFSGQAMRLTVYWCGSASIDRAAAQEQVQVCTQYDYKYKELFGDTCMRLAECVQMWARLSPEIHCGFKLLINLQLLFLQQADPPHLLLSLRPVPVNAPYRCPKGTNGWWMATPS